MKHLVLLFSMSLIATACATNGRRVDLNPMLSLTEPQAKKSQSSDSGSKRCTSRPVYNAFAPQGQEQSYVTSCD